VPSYTIQLILNEIHRRNFELSKSQILPTLVEIGKKTLEAEESYVLDAVERILAERQFRFQDQLESRLDALDGFLEGLNYGSEEPLNPQAVFGELKELLRIRFELDPAQIKELAEGPGDDLQEELSSQLELQLKELEFKRLVGGVERLLGDPLEGDEISAADHEWETLSALIEERVKSQFNERLRTYFEDPEDPKIVKSIEAGLNEIPGSMLAKSDLIKLLGIMAEGRRAAFDKKSHKRIWLRTQRLRYTFFAAELLAQMDPDEIESDILSHLEEARIQLQLAWGASELFRLKDSQISKMEDKFKSMVKADFGEDGYHKYASQTLESLPAELREYLQQKLGGSAMNNIYRELFLRVISELWVEYLTEMEALRVAIGLEAYAQRDPLVQYKSRGFEMFQRLMENMRVGVISRMFTFQPRNVSRIQAGVEEENPASREV